MSLENRTTANELALDEMLDKQDKIDTEYERDLKALKESIEFDLEHMLSNLNDGGDFTHEIEKDDFEDIVLDYLTKAKVKRLLRFTEVRKKMGV